GLECVPKTSYERTRTNYATTPHKTYRLTYGFVIIIHYFLLRATSLYFEEEMLNITLDYLTNPELRHT
ncbi:MAG: hypothetical protein Q4A79_03475, partial [Candidatus Saccharibacteria bacterium]|nr:hypothetical protein [Candidatus Saccharibacteria bacterium]